VFGLPRKKMQLRKRRSVAPCFGHPLQRPERLLNVAWVRNQTGEDLDVNGHRALPLPCVDEQEFIIDT
jgi:hypothetical protein